MLRCAHRRLRRSTHCRHEAVSSDVPQLRRDRPQGHARSISTCSRSACRCRRSSRSCIAPAARCCSSWAFRLALGRTGEPRLSGVVRSRCAAFIGHPLAKLVRSRSRGRTCTTCSPDSGTCRMDLHVGLDLGPARRSAAVVFAAALAHHLDRGDPAMVNPTRKKHVVGAHYGLADWLAQRFTAAVMIVYTLFAFGHTAVARRPRPTRRGRRCSPTSLPGRDVRCSWSR